jgi:iduronate 2-sulfatase
VAETIDLFPTLCDLTGLKKPGYLDGDSLLPQLKDAGAPSDNAAISYSNRARTLRTATHRLIAHKDGHLELYDHTTPEGETKNLAKEEPGLAKKLLTRLQSQ